MATLTNKQLAELRRQLAAGSSSVTWDKVVVNAALQAIEDYSEATARAGLIAAIEAAAPGVFTLTQKEMMMAFFIRQKAMREGV